jgi:hypothetical protein
MNEIQLSHLFTMFMLQTMHVVETAEEVIAKGGVKAAHDEIEEEVDQRIHNMTAANNKTGEYEFIDALVLPSLLLAALYLDLDIAHIELVENGHGDYTLVDRGIVQ